MRFRLAWDQRSLFRALVSLALLLAGITDTQQRAREGPGSRTRQDPSGQPRLAGVSAQRASPSLQREVGGKSAFPPGDDRLSPPQPRRPVSSGYVRSVRRQAKVRAAPSSTGQRRCGSPSARSGGATKRSPRSSAGPLRRWGGQGRARTHWPTHWQQPHGRRAPP